MSRKKAFIKTVSIILSLLILLTVLPLGVSAADTNAVTPVAETRDVTLEATDNTKDMRVRTEEGAGLNTIVVDNGDGTHTMTLYDHPVKYVDEKGDVQDISLEIASAADGSYKTKANNIQTVFPKKISDGITLSGNGVSVKLTPGSGGSSRLSGTELRTAEDVGPYISGISADSTVTKLDSETVSYYYDNRTTLEYSLTYTGFKEDIVVSEYTGQTEYHFLLETGGLTLTKIDESYYLTDAEGTVKATLGDIIIFTADERNNALGSMTHTTVRENQQYIVTIHIDAEYLKDEKTVYPIRIDPTIEITYEGNGASAIQDVTLNQNSGSSGTSGSLYVGKRNTYGISRTLMKFPGLNLNSIPSNCIIDSAYLEIRDLMCETTEMTLTASMFMGNEWDESTANWSNTDSSKCTYIRYSTTNVSYDNGNALSQKHRYSINITQAIRLWKSGLYPFTKGIILKADDSVENGSSALYKTFASYNRASNKPSLKINYTSNVTHTAYGWLGFVNSSVINGWVWCSNHPSESLDVVLTITNTDTNQSWRTVGPASIYRSDVKDAGFGTGYYGFSCSMGDWLAFPEGQYSVSAQAVLPNGSVYTLHASPKTYTHSLIRINTAHLSLDVGGTSTLTATALTNDISLSNLSWTSSNATVAQVNSTTGKVTAIEHGIAIVTVTTADGKHRATCEVWVRGKTPVFLIHGRTSNSFTAWGAGNRIMADPLNPDECNNSHFNPLLNAYCEGGLSVPYIAKSSQDIYGYDSGLTITVDGVETPNFTVPAIFNGKFEDGKYTSVHPEGGNLAYYLKEHGYTENVNLFVFNYPNEDAVKHSALKFEAYINNLIDFVRNDNSDDMKVCFYASRADFDARNHKINLVGHSMGGLVSRYYIENLEHDTNVDKLITICTPHWGSGYGNVSNFISVNHVLCDHDLAFYSAMFGGSETTSLDCSTLGLNCYDGDYTLTDTLQYSKDRSTKYYAIAGIDYTVVELVENEPFLKLPTNFTTFQQIQDFMTENSIYKGAHTEDEKPMIVTEVGDNMVGFMSQIGWTENMGESPNKRIQMEEIYVLVDTNGGNGEEKFIWEAVLEWSEGNKLLHSKINHREPVLEKVYEFLED